VLPARLSTANPPQRIARAQPSVSCRRPDQGFHPFSPAAFLASAYAVRVWLPALHAGATFVLLVHSGKCGGIRPECDLGPTILIGSAVHDLGQSRVDNDDRGGQRR